MKLSDFKSENALLWGKLIEFGVDVGVEFMMVEFAKIKCKEQRVLCSQYAKAGYTPLGFGPDRENVETFVIYSSILQAPEPEM